MENKKGGTLHHWFKGSKSKDGKPGWVQADGSPCANEPGETKTPKCFSSGRLARLKKSKRGKSIIRSAVLRKRKKDPQQQSKTGASAPTYVRTFAKGKKDPLYVKAEPKLKESMEIQEATRDIPGKGSGKKDACYYKVKSRFKVWPSGYGSASLVRCRKKGAANWGTQSEGVKNDHEYSMARAELDTIIRSAKRAKRKVAKGEGNLEAWLQSKITKSADYINTAANYMDSGEVNEGRKYCSACMKKKDKCKCSRLPISESRKRDNVANALLALSFAANVAQSPKDLLRSGHIEGPGMQLMSRMMKRRGEANRNLDSARVSHPARNRVVKENKQRSKEEMVALLINLLRNEKKRKNYLLNYGYIGEDKTPAWTRNAGKDLVKGGLNRKGIASYRRQNPGSKLSMAVTTPPSKLKKGSKSWKRRKSFCSRMGGMPGPMKDEKGRPTRKALSLRKWNC